MKKNKGFTLIELLVVIAIIGILSSVVLASLSSAREKGKDAAVKSQLASMKAQAELFFSKNELYTGVCAGTIADNGFGTVSGPGLLFSAYSSSGSATGIISPNTATQTYAQAVCNDTADGWAVSVPLSASNATTSSFYCVDNTGLSKDTSAALAAGAVVCS